MSTSILLTFFLFFHNAFFVNCHALFSNNSPYNGAHFELIHRHSSQLSGNGRTIGPPKNQLERLKQLVHSDNARQQVIYRRLGRPRRKSLEVGVDLVQISLRSAADTGAGQYFVSFRVGSPPQKMVLIADTGSDLTWMNCNYRRQNYSKGESLDDQPRRFFQANQSPSFEIVPCLSDMCLVDLANSFSLSQCPTPITPCAYDYRYKDGTKVKGFFAKDTITVSRGNSQKVRLQNVLIGCTQSFEGNFHEVDGIMGLGYSNQSFAIAASSKFGNKFSYCLVDHLSPSNLINYLTFGNTARSPHLPNIQYTELLLGAMNPFYAVKIIGISIGGLMLKNIPSEIWDVDGAGGVILDSGSSLTFLAEPAYKPVMDALKAPLMKFKKVQLEVGNLEFCFNATGFEESLMPRFAFHFANGVQFVPPVKSYVIDAADEVKCLGFASAEWPGTTVIGNIMQQNHFWEFDLANGKLGFAPSICTTFKSKVI